MEKPQIVKDIHSDISKLQKMKTAGEDTTKLQESTIKKMELLSSIFLELEYLPE